MKFFVSLVLALAACGSPAAFASGPQVSYVQRLVDQTEFRHPKIATMAIYSAADGKGPLAVVASNHPATIGQQGTPDVTSVADSGKALCQTGEDGSTTVALVPLRDIKDQTVGVLRIDTAGGGTAVLNEHTLDQAERIRDELQEVIPSREELFDVYDLTASPDAILAQRLIIALARRHPEVLVLAMHLKAPGESEYKIWATNRPIIMKSVEPDQTDPNVSERGYSVLEMFGQTHRMVAELPIRAVDGSVCGALVVLSLWQNESEAPGYLARAMAVRDELQSQIPSYDALFKP